MVWRQRGEQSREELFIHGLASAKKSLKDEKDGIKQRTEGSRRAFVEKVTWFCKD